MSKYSRPASLLAAVLAISGAAGIIQIASPAFACACGAFTPPNGLNGPLQMNSEASILSLADGQETIEMRLGVNSMTHETGLIFPTPAPAQVGLGSADDFTALAKEMTPEQKTEYDWWTWHDPFSTGAAPGGAMDGGAPQVLDQVQLGPVRATTLAASDPKGLSDWLTAEGYGVSDAISALLPHYTDKGWFFVALKLTGDVPLNGDLDPLTFTFASETLVYPMALSQAATTTQRVFLYVFADHRQDVRFMDGTDPYVHVTWARTVRDQDLQSHGAYLTALSMDFYQPSTQITDDLELRQSSTDEEAYTVIWTTEYVGIMGVPAGWLLVGLGVIVAALGAAISVRRQSRKTAVS